VGTTTAAAAAAIMLGYSITLITTLAISGVLGQATFQCPSKGYFADSEQCDKYYDCYSGVAEEKLCPDGLVFDYRQESSLERCEYPFLVACQGTMRAANPLPTTQLECPRQNGLFEHEDPTNCMDYYECTGGKPVKKTCFIGGVFDEFSGVCHWAASGLRTGCEDKKKSVNGFVCPNEPQLDINGGPNYAHGRYADPDDCRFFFTCQNGVNPVRNGCTLGLVFNDVTFQCDDPRNVAACEYYYAQ